MIETHAHFFGSLPLSFIHQSLHELPELSEKHEKTWNSFFPAQPNRISLAEMSTALNSIFCASPERNGLQFHQIYGLLHDLLRETFGAKIFDLYKLGSEALAEQAMKNGVLRSTILVGTSDNLEIMKEKLSGISEGFSIAETKYQLKPSNFVRLTFTRNREGAVINCSPTSLADLLQFLEKEPKLDSRIDGFDFCGFENPKNLTPTYDYLALLSEHNAGRIRRNLSPHIVSVHAGENCLDW